MIRVLITDTHFGWKQNSITWLNSQMKFLDEQLIPFLERQTDDVRLIHLGDIFDSRSSINPMVAKAVRERFTKMRSLVKDFYIVAGNHDFYSPNSDEIDSLSLAFQDMDINLVIRDIVYADGDAFIPWYKYKEIESVSNIRNIFTHADIFGEDRKVFPGVRIFSGHIHIPQINKRMGLYNLGSCYPLDFADANQERFMYVLTDDGQLISTSNSKSINFWRIYNMDIFNPIDSDQDYYEFYIDQTNMQNPEYQSRIAELAKRLKNMWVIPVIPSLIAEGEEMSSYNIDKICESLIPDHLKEKFQIIKNRVQA